MASKAGGGAIPRPSGFVLISGIPVRESFRRLKRFGDSRNKHNDQKRTAAKMEIVAANGLVERALTGFYLERGIRRLPHKGNAEIMTVRTL